MTIVTRFWEFQSRELQEASNTSQLKQLIFHQGLTKTKLIRIYRIPTIMTALTKPFLRIRWLGISPETLLRKEVSIFLINQAMKLTKVAFSHPVKLNTMRRKADAELGLLVFGFSDQSFT
jgi:hypothetical protein